MTVAAKKWGLTRGCFADFAPGETVADYEEKIAEYLSEKDF